MSSDEMNELIQKRQKARIVQKKNQIPYAAVLLVLACACAGFLWVDVREDTVFWVLGIAFGFVMRDSRFCFASTFRDVFLVRNTKLMRALILSLMVSTVGFAVIQSGYLRSHPDAGYSDIPGILNSVGPHTAIGAFLFGIGMALAGGCAASVLMRIGEGHVLPLITLLGFLIGTVMGARDYPFWYDRIIQNCAVVYFPEYMDFGTAVMLQIAVLAGLYGLASWYQKRMTETER
ncbi:transporter [Caproiciproducens sp. NJN-50]|uniref:YeeE/YedE thiosulfate transporter family protein n=1 Tax=Acutalibacteraceae TaxID=3082771 RepID=UPI000FFE1122|nr:MULTISPECIES: YeeE/YedE thiosulfate transporter family protein [Acutalibacteraceae]QAT48891.1 transporter [Caproiciproducens sp. NJN-50]